MKTKLLLRVVNLGEIDDIGRDEEYLEIAINFNDKRIHEVFSRKIDTGNKEDFLSNLEDAINESTIYTVALGIKLTVEDSVFEFLHGLEEEIEKFVRRLLVTI